MNCGAACLQMVAFFHGKYFSQRRLSKLSYVSREGASLLGMSKAAAAIGFSPRAARIDWEYLKTSVSLPVIISWNANHFVVVFRIGSKRVWISDPAVGIRRYSVTEFQKSWLNGNCETGTALLLSPTSEFGAQTDDRAHRRVFQLLVGYFREYSEAFVQSAIGLLLASALLLALPLLTRLIVDKGIGSRNIGFVFLLLIAQLTVSVSRASVDYVRGLLLMHMGTRINLSLVYDFLSKLMRLPVSYFDARNTGDILQRIGDHQRIEGFLTSTAIQGVYSILSLIALGAYLCLLNRMIFSVFLAGALLYVLWILAVLRQRRQVDEERFNELADNQNRMIHAIRGMPEIKLGNAERKKLAQWSRVQERLFSLSLRALRIAQRQEFGGNFISELTSVAVTFLSAKSVIDGTLSLGEMMAIQVIVGQLYGPLRELTTVGQSLQDAAISLERISEVHREEEELRTETTNKEASPVGGDIVLNNVSFHYDGVRPRQVLTQVSCAFRSGQVTAIVGESGSGKTTLIKLLLGFYKPTVGRICVGGRELESMNVARWRNSCGAVLQDGYLFSESIANNVALREAEPDPERLWWALRLANLDECVKALPRRENTLIGPEGVSLSTGQSQRILIARALYKQPEYIFFDEATNALDARNEKDIMVNLFEHFRDKTIVVAAHRLSTVMSADQILVLHDGRIAQVGCHDELCRCSGVYRRLVEAQISKSSDGWFGLSSREGAI